MKYAPMSPVTVDASSRYIIVEIRELSHYEHGGAGCGGVVVEVYQAWFEQKMESNQLVSPYHRAAQAARKMG